MELPVCNLFTYVGDLLDGQRCGHGEITYISGVHYVGEFKNDEFDGIGILTFPGDFVYSGSFLSGMPHGKGEKNYYLTSRFYCGMFKKGKYDGEAFIKEPGVYTFHGLCVSDTQDPCNDFSGAEKTYTSRKKEYLTNPIDPKLTGFGRVVFEDGKVYCGGILNGRFHGNGVFKLTKRKKKVKGHFHYGFLLGYYTLFLPYGMKTWAKQSNGSEFVFEYDMPLFKGSYEDDSDLFVMNNI